MIEDSLVPACSDPLQLSVFVLLPFCDNVSTALSDLVRHKSIRWGKALESSPITILNDMTIIN